MFEVTSTNRWNELDGENGPPMFDMDAHIADMLEGCLASPRNLREQFSNHARPYFSTGFNWLEIDTIVTTILPRFHQRIEGMRVSREAERLNLGAPADVLMAYGLDPMPGITPQCYSDYGGEHAVTAMDMRPTTRGRARRNPLVLMGCWSNTAEIAVGTGYGTYDVHNVENYPAFTARMESGAHDRLNRARFLRRLCENMKRSIGIVDTIAFPRDDPANMPYWSSLIGSPAAPPGTTMHWLANTMVTDTVKWSWIAAKCKETVDTCSHCAEKGHRVENCSNKDKQPKCANCKGPYTARHMGCTFRAQQVRNLVRNTTYN